MKFLDTSNQQYFHNIMLHSYTVWMSSQHTALRMMQQCCLHGTCGCSLPVDSTGGVSARAQCKQTASEDIHCVSYYHSRISHE